MLELIILIIKAIAKASDNSAGNRGLSPEDAARLAEWERAQREWQAQQLRALTGVSPTAGQSQRPPAIVQAGVGLARNVPPPMRVVPPPVPVLQAVEELEVAPPMAVSSPISSRTDGAAGPRETIPVGRSNHRVEARARFILAEVLKPPLSMRSSGMGAR